MPSNKDRLYVGLYARGGAPTMPGGEDRHHWALLRGPKSDGKDAWGMRYHAKQSIIYRSPQWHLEQEVTHVVSTSRILVRVLVAKVLDPDKLTAILHNVPIRPEDPGWNCVLWVKEALEILRDDDEALGRKMLDWQTVRDCAMDFWRRKMDEGHWKSKEDEVSTGREEPKTLKTPTYDLLSDREIL